MSDISKRSLGDFYRCDRCGDYIFVSLEIDEYEEFLCEDCAFDEVFFPTTPQQPNNTPLPSTNN